MKIQFLLFMLTEISFGGELPGNWQQEWPVFLKSEMLRNQHAFFPLVKIYFIKEMLWKKIKLSWNDT